MKPRFFIWTLILILLSSCSSAPKQPTEEPAPAALSAVEKMGAYFRTINEAETPNDLAAAWDMFTDNQQCSGMYKCDLSYFQDKWKDQKVEYQLYDCGKYLVVAGEKLYPRNGSPDAVEEYTYRKYQLVVFEGVLRIDDIYLTDGPGESCLPVSANGP